jgi:replicative DNA helicase
MEIRAKARRLRSRIGDLGVVVVDYIQLMSGRSRAENRQVEVSEISRGLKILARELDAPVIALAQLNRQLEARADKRPMLSDLRESGCLTAGTRLLRADTNVEITLGELVASEAHDVPVWSLDDHRRFVPARLTHAFATGVHPVLRMWLASGRTVDATANHRFHTPDGWRRLDGLLLGDRLAVPKDLGALATSDVMWDRIAAIEALGEQPVYDATVDGTHNFIANGVVAHNSLEQDADVVVFLYRDDVYNADTPDRGTAEIIVAKHRNGPTGKVRLAWLDHYTKFANMAPGV